MLLPQISDPFEYKRLFAQDSPWLLAVEEIKKRHSLQGQLTRGDKGTHIVFRCQDHWIKLMAPFYKSDMAFEIEGLLAVSQKLSVATPQIIAKGEIEGWAYLVMNHVEGIAIKDIWPKLNESQKSKCAKQMAQTILQIQKIAPGARIKERLPWNHFIRDQYENLEAQLNAKDLEKAWIQGACDFMKQFPLNSFQTSNPSFLHCDFTYDHFLLNDKGEIQSVIDFADAQWGHPEYELVAPAVFILAKQREPLNIFLSTLGYKGGMAQLMAWALLHRFLRLQESFSAEMASLSAGDYPGLTKVVFPD